MADNTVHLPASPPPDWDIARPEKPPGSSLAPAALSLASTFLVWGLISSPIISGVGAILFVASLAAWIKSIRHERNS
jgi:hypothetical protein